MKRHHDQGNSLAKELNWGFAYSFRGEFVTVRVKNMSTGRPGAGSLAESIHLNHKKKAERGAGTG